MARNSFAAVGVVAAVLLATAGGVIAHGNSAEAAAPDPLAAGCWVDVLAEYPDPTTTGSSTPELAISTYKTNVTAPAERTLVPGRPGGSAFADRQASALTRLTRQKDAPAHAARFQGSTSGKVDAVVQVQEVAPGDWRVAEQSIKLADSDCAS
jgi:hypothetical protein